MSFTKKVYGTNKPFAHMFFFQLSDTSKEVANKFIDLCVEYLSGHTGQEHFSIGYRALEINRNVSATNFEISIHMIFKSIEAFEKYSANERHERFITESAGMSPTRIVYDSFLQVSVQPAIKGSKK